MSMRKPTTDCVALHYGGGAALNAEPEWCTTPRCGAAGRREAMAPHVLDEQEAFYRDRELVIPAP